jgi:8-oxo-dGTP pyrophosphatase MutT (NUDIX family)
MTPPFRGDEGLVPRPEREGFREASVLILLHPTHGGLSFPLIERPRGLRHHAGQIAFPGGALEPGESPLDAALRETEEEIGVRLPESSILGALSEISALPSGYHVHPFVAYAEETPVYRLQREEVDELFEIPLAALTNPASISSFSMRRDDKDWSVPCYDFGGRIVWGLTAMILAEFARLAASYIKILP